MSTHMPWKSALVALTLLVAVGAAVGTAGAVTNDGDVRAVDDQPRAVSTVPNTTNYLSPETTDRTSFVRGDVDVTAAAGASAQRLQGQYERNVFDTRFESIPEDEQVDLVRETADSTDARLDRLATRYEVLLTAYSNGSLSPGTFLRRVARLSVDGEVARSNLEHVSERVDDSGTSVPVTLETRITDLQTTPATLPDPVVDRTEAGLAGQRDPPVVYTGGAGSGLVLATVDDGELIRTATIPGDYAPDQPDQFAQAEGREVILALQRGGELYPWAYDNNIGGPQIRGFGNTGIYLIRVNYGHGTLQTYLSGGSGQPFHEIQTTNPEGVPVTDTTVRATDSLNVTVETTTDSGPMRITLIQPSTNAPLNGTVSVDGQVVGRTGDDGTLWTVQPAGQFRVNVTDGPNSVEVAVP